MSLLRQTNSSSKKLWAGRFSKGNDSLMEKFNASLSFDRRLYRQDIEGSCAHAEMLKQIKVLSAKELKSILQGLKTIENKFKQGTLQFPDSEEDIHTKIENELRKEIGNLAGKLHTGRSRNDQSNLDVRMYLREQIDDISNVIAQLMKTLLLQAEKHKNHIMPGMTHLQPAQPITLGYYWLSHFFMLHRDYKRMQNTRKVVNSLPLGAGALAGVNYPSDREFLRQRLQFDSVIENAMDAVSDRDHLLEFHSNSVITVMHLSRLAEELILFSNPQFGFIKVDEKFATGSSIMPNKINPDSLELIRGKTGRIYGNLTSLITVMKSLPLAYNKDLQEDKESLFDTADHLEMSLLVMEGVISTLQVFPKKMRNACERGYLQATDVADYLVKKGIPFRQAHQVSASLVRYLEKTNKTYTDLDLQDFKKFSPLFTADILPLLQLENLIMNKKSPGSTSPQSVAEQIQTAKKVIRSLKKQR